MRAVETAQTFLTAAEVDSLVGDYLGGMGVKQLDRQRRRAPRAAAPQRRARRSPSLRSPSATRPPPRDASRVHHFVTLLPPARRRSCEHPMLGSQCGLQRVARLSTCSTLTGQSRSMGTPSTDSSPHRDSRSRAARLCQELRAFV
ncbi:hypothetical protein D8Y24_07840 [Agrococcus lahaulensis]|nr:hypothetical protein D8Y24_07840 [Agrococcus lahaulensis]